MTVGLEALMTLKGSYMSTSHFSTSLLPVKTRIVSIDVLRGFALFGIFYAHMIFWFSGGPLPQELYQSQSGVGSGLAVGFYMLFIIGKFFAIFSFLFGLSFYIQIQGLVRRHENVLLRFGWRLCILGVIGLLHHAIWRADILSIYVPLGFLLMVVRNLSNKVLLVVGMAFVLNLPTKIAELISFFVWGKIELISVDLPAAGAEYYEVVKNASFVEMVKHNIGAIKDKYAYQVTSGRFIITFGFFLLGMLAGRMQWFENILEKRELFLGVCKKSGWVLLGALVVAAVFAGGIYVGGVNIEKTPLVLWFGGLLVDVVNVSLTLVYISGMGLLMLRPKWQRLCLPLADIGKMALTVYLLQTCCGLLLFYNFGLGLFTVTTALENIIICIGFFVLQAALCRWWLRYFYYGPVEWLWRSATDLKIRPMKK